MSGLASKLIFTTVKLHLLARQLPTPPIRPRGNTAEIFFWISETQGHICLFASQIASFQGKPGCENVWLHQGCQHSFTTDIVKFENLLEGYSLARNVWVVSLVKPNMIHPNGCCKLRMIYLQMYSFTRCKISWHSNVCDNVPLQILIPRKRNRKTCDWNTRIKAYLQNFTLLVRHSK